MYQFAIYLLTLGKGAKSEKIWMPSGGHDHGYNDVVEYSGLLDCGDSLSCLMDAFIGQEEEEKDNYGEDSQIHEVFTQIMTEGLDLLSEALDGQEEGDFQHMHHHEPTLEGSEEIVSLENFSGEDWTPIYPKVDDETCPVMMTKFLEESGEEAHKHQIFMQMMTGLEMGLDHHGKEEDNYDFPDKLIALLSKENGAEHITGIVSLVLTCFALLGLIQ